MPLNLNPVGVRLAFAGASAGTGRVTTAGAEEPDSKPLPPHETAESANRDQFVMKSINPEESIGTADHQNKAIGSKEYVIPIGLFLDKKYAQRTVSNTMGTMGAVPSALGFNPYEWLERKLIYEGHNSSWGASLEQVKREPEKYLAASLGKRERILSPQEKQAMVDEAKRILNQVEEVRFHSKSGIDHYGWYCPAKPGKPTIVLSRGNNGREPLGGLLYRRKLIQAGYGFFSYEYPGYGLTQGVPSESACYHALEAASDFLAEKKQIPASDQVAYGVSLGTAVTVDVASKRPFKAVILQSPFTAMPDVVSQIMPVPNWLFPLHEHVPSKFDSLSKIDKITSPLLFLHGLEDTLISPQCTDELFAKATTPQKEKHFFANTGHMMNPDETGETIDSFLKKLMAETEK